MPVFKVTVKEEITRKAVAYVEAADSTAADKWSGTAPDHLFRRPDDNEDSVWAEVDTIEEVASVPDGWKLRT